MLSKRSWWKLRSMGGTRLSEAASEDLCQHPMFRSYSQNPYHQAGSPLLLDVLMFALRHEAALDIGMLPCTQLQLTRPGTV